LRLAPPRCAAADTRQQVEGSLAVAAAWFVRPAPRECRSECVGIDRAVAAEHLDDRQRHRGVIGPSPWSLDRDQTLRGAARSLVQRTKHRLAERIANGEPCEGPSGEHERFVVHRPQ
jgi:hypothetical protein